MTSSPDRDMKRCEYCYGDVRGECILAGFCIVNPPPLFSRLRKLLSRITSKGEDGDA